MYRIRDIRAGCAGRQPPPRRATNCGPPIREPAQPDGRTLAGDGWTQATWNPATGCDRVSAGCDNCYALTLAGRLKAMGSAKYQTDGDPRTSDPGFGLALHPTALPVPARWREPRMIFVNSISDLFHAQVPLSYVSEVFAVMADTPRHTYQLLTKRARRLRRLAYRLDWPTNL